ncbi:MAG: hypothetical protein ACFFCS_20670 [Candidatus Hodarchaeota archaeon]
MGGECSKCGSSFIERTAICQECRVGFPLCSSCDPESRCPKCDTPWPEWNIV